MAEGIISFESTSKMKLTSKMWSVFVIWMENHCNRFKADLYFDFVFKHRIIKAIPSQYISLYIPYRHGKYSIHVEISLLSWSVLGFVSNSRDVELCIAKNLYLANKYTKYRNWLMMISRKMKLLLNQQAHTAKKGTEVADLVSCLLPCFFLSLSTAFNKFQDLLVLSAYAQTLSESAVQDSLRNRDTWLNSPVACKKCALARALIYWRKLTSRNSNMTHEFCCCCC